MHCAGAQMIATDREVEIPPQTAKLGPTRYEVKLGEGMEIPIAESELRKDGQLITKDGAKVVKFDKKAFDIIARKYDRENKRPETKNARKTTKRDEGPEI